MRRLRTLSRVLSDSTGSSVPAGDSDPAGDWGSAGDPESALGCEPAGVSGAFRDRQSAGYSEDTEALWAAVSDGNAVLNFRSSILPEISEAHEDEPELKDFLIHAGQLNLLKENYSDLVEFTGSSIKAELPQPGLQAALNYINYT